ncbi:transcription factor bHLH162-like [Nicotiana sylvestris]|uniref:Transcription factor bHLH55-like n=1 Tax=Nicotiana sylvestris TaxID=4096 RepID=A0A1U7Y095_NICSY|nr:PREDICTED: transcription factor bHLH55-like [Nicotiana sylvestris]
MEQQCNNPSSSSSKADRKTIEKNRRNQMKALYLKLHSLVPHQQHSREVLSLPDQLEEAINYIKRLQIDLGRMTQKKDSLKSGENSSCGRKIGLPLPHLEINSVDSALQVVITTSLDYQFIFTDVIRLLHEESVQVINANYTLIGDTIVHSIHSQMGECAPDQYGAARISERLKKFVGGC